MALLLFLFFCGVTQQKLEVDDLHLQLQNLKYEAMHLRREISNCLEFRYSYILQSLHASSISKVCVCVEVYLQLWVRE